MLAGVFLLLPAGADAAITAIGSPLTRPATLNTAANLGYPGVNTAVPASPEAPTGEVHTYHFGADTAIWNTRIAHGDAAMPEAGQAVKVRLEGCAEAAPGGPPPLTQIHFQALTPVSGGGVQVALTSQPFNVPVCGQDAASALTVTTYEPVNLCVNRGDYVGFNDEGGFVERYYRNGVPFSVLAPSPGSSLASFIRGGGTNDGAIFSPLDVSAMEGFSNASGEELTMQVLLGTGPDARYVCPGGTKDAPAVFAPMRISRQTDGINSQRIVSVAVYCRPTSGCQGTGTLKAAGRSVGVVHFNLHGDSTSHVQIRVSSSLMPLIRRDHGVATTFTAEFAGRQFSQTVLVKIF